MESQFTKEELEVIRHALQTYFDEHTNPLTLSTGQWIYIQKLIEKIDEMVKEW